MNISNAHVRITDWIINVVFIGILFVPLVLSVIQPDLPYSKIEKRTLTKFPLTTDLDSITIFPEHFDAYYQDHFGLREWLIHRYQREMDKRFDITGVSVVTEGNDGWLFFIGNGVLDDFRGKLHFSYKEEQQFCRNIIAKQDWLALRNILYIPLVVANKQSIYAKHHPVYYQLGKKQTRLDRLLESCNKDEETLILDLRPALIRSKGEGRLYDKTDTHWNYLGAHVGYLEIMDKVQKHFPDFIYRQQFSFAANWKTFTGGDLALMLGKRGVLHETKPVLEENELSARVKQLPVELDELLPLRRLEPEMTERKGSGLRLLVLHDSFFNHLKPFVSENFNQVLYIWQFYDEETLHLFTRKKLEQVLSIFKPDLVIEEVAERSLDRMLYSIDQDWTDE